MVVALVALPPRRMERDVGHHPPRHERLPREPPHQLHPLRVGQLVGQRHAHLAGDLAVLARLGLLDPVPQLGPVGDPARRVGGGEDFRVIDAARAA